MTGIAERLGLKLVIGVGCVLLLTLLVHDRNRWKAKTAQYAEMLSAEKAAHAATAGHYRAAAERARAEDAANAARVRTRQAMINERTSREYESRIAAARAAARSLRRDAETAAADSRTGRAAAVPGLSPAAERPDQTAGDDGFPRSRRLIATEQAIQLDELIKWVRQQAEVEVTASSD